MRKIFLILFMGISMIFSQNVLAEKPLTAGKALAATAETTAEAVETVYGDGRAAVDTMYHDGKSIVKTLYGDGKEFLKGAYPQVREAVVSIGKAIGCAAEHVYEVLVKKYFIDGLKEALICLVGLFLLIFGWIKLELYIKRKSGIKIERIDDYDQKVYENLSLDWRVLYPVALVTAGVIVLCNVNYSDMLVNLLNPEWGAINYIVDFTKNLVK